MIGETAGSVKLPVKSLQADFHPLLFSSRRLGGGALQLLPDKRNHLLRGNLQHQRELAVDQLLGFFQAALVALGEFLALRFALFFVQV